MHMKKLLLLLFAGWCLQGFLPAQTPYWCETFDIGQGWSLDENWSVADGKLRFYWSPASINFDLSAVSPVISLDAGTQQISIIQYLDAFNSSSPPETAEIILLCNGTEDILWSHQLSSGNWGQTNGSELMLDISNYGGEDIRIKFRTYGFNTYNWNWWDIFELRLITLFENDVAITQITGPTVMDAHETATWQLAVSNLGSQPQSGFSLNLKSYRYGETIGEMLVEEPLGPQETVSFSFDWTPDTAQNTALFGTVSIQGDEFQDNDRSNGHFVRVRPDMAVNVLVWDHDNAIQTIIDPETGEMLEPSAALMRVLDDAGIMYDYAAGLPANLYDYDIVMATMGCYCVS